MGEQQSPNCVQVPVGRRLKPSLLALILFFTSSTALSICQAGRSTTEHTQAEAHAEQGLALAQAGNVQAAEAQLRQAVLLAPEDISFLDELATVLAMQKKFEESSLYFQKALTIDPTDLLARRYLAANLWQTHRFVEARKNLQILLRAIPDDPQALLLLGMVSENTKDYATAARTLSAVPDLVRAQPESIAALARSYYHIGESQKARTWLNELQNHPAGLRAALLAIQIADEMHDYKTAEAFLASLAPHYPNETELRYQLALIKFHMENFEESRHILQELVEDGHATKEVDRLLASCFEAEDQPEEAIRALQNTIELDPGDEATYLDLAGVLLNSNKISEAMQLAQRMVQAFPASPRVFASKGSIELRAGNFIDAVSSFARAAQLDPADAEAIIGLARAQANAGMMQQAKATLESAIQRFPKKAPFGLELGQVLLKEAEAGNARAQEKAEQLFRSAMAHDDSLAEAHYELGELALGRRELAEALVHLKIAAKLSPSSAKAHFALSRAYRRLGREQDAVKEMALFEKFKE
jgi:tetratricopeptide (TPR) repeat protein